MPVNASDFGAAADAINAAIDAKVAPVAQTAANAVNAAAVNSQMIDGLDARITAIEQGTTQPVGPEILSITAAPAQTSVVVTVMLYEPAPCRTEYRTPGGAWLPGPDETSYSYSTHQQTITGLTAGTAYEVRAIAYDEARETASVPVAFTTTSAPAVATRGPRPAAVQTSPTFALIPSSIPSNGTGDVGPAITSWLNSLAPGTVALFAPAGVEGFRHGVDTPPRVYRMTSIGVNVKPGVRLWGYGCKIDLRTPGTAFNHAAFSIYPQGDLDVRGFEIAGQNTAAGTNTAHNTSKQHGMGISIAGNPGAIVTASALDLWIHHTWSDGIFVAGWGDTDFSPAGFDFGHLRIEYTGRYGITLNQNDSGDARIHDSIIRDTALNLIGGEDQRLGTEKAINLIVEDCDLGTFMWHDTGSWLPHGIGWNYDWWNPLPNIADCGPITIRRNKWIGGCAPAMFARHGSATNFISQETKPGQNYHDIVVADNDWSGVPNDQRSVARWARVHNTARVTLTGNTGLGAMVNRYTTTGSTGVVVGDNA